MEYLLSRSIEVINEARIPWCVAHDEVYVSFEDVCQGILQLEDARSPRPEFVPIWIGNEEVHIRAIRVESISHGGAKDLEFLDTKSLAEILNGGDVLCDLRVDHRLSVQCMRRFRTSTVQGEVLWNRAVAMPRWCIGERAAWVQGMSRDHAANLLAAGRAAYAVPNRLLLTTG